MSISSVSEPESSLMTLTGSEGRGRGREAIILNILVKGWQLFEGGD